MHRMMKNEKKKKLNNITCLYYILPFLLLLVKT